MRLARLAARYLWAAPATLIGIALAGAACACGATVRVREGVVEVAGGRLARLPGAVRSLHVIAITFGHVVLGVSHAVLERERAHEHAHVRQYERWGPLLLPLYAASSGLAILTGGKAYRDNAFERQARAAEPASDA
jgi:hypothetical protein